MGNTMVLRGSREWESSNGWPQEQRYSAAQQEGCEGEEPADKSEKIGTVQQGRQKHL